MLLYDPQHPAMFGVLKLCQATAPVEQFVQRHPRTPEFTLFFNCLEVGRISVVCGRLFCQSAIVNGICAVHDTWSRYFLGHVIVQDAVAVAVIPSERSTFPLDNSFLYKFNR